ncbi:MAG: hypothetical protein ABFS35_06130 [Bacteroidota bacterium]
MRAKDIFDDISTWETVRKAEFCEHLLYDLTIMNRAIWDDPDMTDKVKIECLKWSNEFTHRLWKILRDLKIGQDENTAQGLLNEVLFVRDQSVQMGRHLGAILITTYENLRNDLNGQRHTR